MNYQEVLDDFLNAKCVRILTYNISKNGYRNKLMDALKSLSPDIDVKIIAPENILYIGSANYSDESQENIESGTLIRDKDAIKRIIDEVFPAIIDESTPYFDDDFNVFRLFVISMERKFMKCQN